MKYSQLSLFDATAAIQASLVSQCDAFYDALDTIVKKHLASRRAFRFSEIRDRFDIWQLTLPESERVTPSPAKWGRYVARLRKLGFKPTTTVLPSSIESRKGGADRVWERVDA